MSTHRRGTPTRHSTRPLRADAQRNRERILAAARRLRRPGRGRADGRRRRAGRRGGRDGVPPLPDEGGAAGRARAPEVRAHPRAAREALTVEDPWEAFAGMLRRDAEMLAEDATLRDALARMPEAWATCEAERPEVAAVAARGHRPRPGGRRAAAGLRRRRHPDAHVRDVRGHGDAAGPRARLAPPPGRRPRRAPRAVGHRRIVARSLRVRIGRMVRPGPQAGVRAGRGAGSVEGTMRWLPLVVEAAVAALLLASIVRSFLGPPRRGRGSRRPSCCSARRARR